MTKHPVFNQGLEFCFEIYMCNYNGKCLARKRCCIKASTFPSINGYARRYIRFDSQNLIICQEEQCKTNASTQLGIHLISHFYWKYMCNKKSEELQTVQPEVEINRKKDAKINFPKSSFLLAVLILCLLLQWQPLNFYNCEKQLQFYTTSAFCKNCFYNCGTESSYFHSVL